jgi:hypothetical protein
MTNSIDVRQQLHDMGYRALEGDVWAKPVGYSIFVYETKSGAWTQRFRSAKDGSTLVWSRVEWEDHHGTLTDFLAYCETWSTHRVIGEGPAGRPWNFRTELQLEI